MILNSFGVGGFVHKVIFVDKVGGTSNLNRQVSPRNQRTEACLEKVMPTRDVIHKAGVGGSIREVRFGVRSPQRAFIEV